MAIVTGGLFGNVRKKIGDVVMSSWKGINVAKSYQPNVANPRTAKQVENRNNFKAVGQLGEGIVGLIIRPLMNRAAKRMSGWNLFVKTNIHFYKGGNLEEPEKLEISSGKMEATPIESATGTAGAKVVNITWTDDSGEGLKLSTDEAYGVVVDVNNNIIFSAIAANALREDGSMEIPDRFNQLSAAETYYAYLAFRRDDGLEVGSTSRLEVTVS